jgi:D-alanine-D-alanine ligase
MKKNIIVLCGGQSAEHEISLISARYIASLISPEKYQVFRVCIDRQGLLHLVNEDQKSQSSVSMTQGVPFPMLRGQGFQEPIHLVFPVLHGPGGEDGTLQGWLECLNVPYVGSGVLSSAVAMDKDVAKKLLLVHGLPVVPFHTVRHEREVPSYEEACELCQSHELFIKPATQGSSVGVSKVTHGLAYKEKIHHAFRYGQKVLIEQAIKGAEVECAVLGHRFPIASGVGEVVMKNEGFYSYEAKYLDAEQADILIKARLSDEMAEKVRDLALKAFQALECSGMARVDFFVRGQEVFINEINTIPGFTPISLYPQLWQHAGVPPQELVQRLMDHAIERFQEKQGVLFFPEHLSPAIERPIAV